MLRSLMKYSALAAKVMAMRAKLLTEQDYEHISEMKSVQEVVDFLKGKPSYASWLEQMGSSMYYREDVEKMLTQSLYADFTRLFRFSGQEQKTFLKTYWKRYEVELINYCLRIVFNHYHRPFDLDYKKEFFDRYSKISIDRLITSRDVNELVDNLAGTEYYDLLKRVRDSGHAQLVDYNLALDLYYFSTMWKKDRKALTGTDLEIFTRDYGTRIDLLNIQWVYRAKKYYHMEPVQIFAMIIPIHYKFKAADMRALVNAKDDAAFEQVLEGNYYFKRYARLIEGKKLEQIYQDIMQYLFLMDLQKHPYSFACMNTYLFLKEREVDKLTTALECVSYELSSSETLDYIGGKAT